MRKAIAVLSPVLLALAALVPPPAVAEVKPAAVGYYYLYPDQDTFRKEEQRRFEILDAHWDVPLSEVEPPR